MTNSHNNTIIKILKSILRWDVLSGIVAILSFSFAVSQHRHDQGGTLDVSYNTQRVYNNESKDIIILTDSEQITFNDIFPNFLNSDKYTLKDFTLSHTLESQGVLINNTGFYTNFQINDCSRVLKYTENILAPHQAAETPISSLLLGDETASCTIKSRATWDGAEKPFEFTVNSYLYHIPSHKNETFDLWRQRSWNMVKEKITSPIYDLVYLSSKGEEKREYNISLNNIYYSREDTKEIADNKETIKETNKVTSDSEKPAEQIGESQQETTSSSLSLDNLKNENEKTEEHVKTEPECKTEKYKEYQDISEFDEDTQDALAFLRTRFS